MTVGTLSTCSAAKSGTTRGTSPSMTRIAIISDVHADVHALSDALAQADRTLAQPAAGETFGILELPSKSFKVLRAADGVEVEIPRLTLGITDKRAR
jgi:hypothetical protein